MEFNGVGERRAPYILRPDPVSQLYLQRRVTGLPTTAAQFIHWFESANQARTVEDSLMIQVCKGDLDYEHWGRFCQKWCLTVEHPEESCETLVSLLRVFAEHSIEGTTNGAEMTVNGIVDSLLAALGAALGLIRERNTSIETSGKCRPDYSLGLGFVGEDKTWRNYLKGVVEHDPEVDLIETTPFADWVDTYGEHVNYIFAYTCIGDARGAIFTLGVLDSATEKFLPLHDVPCNLSVPADRARAAEYVLLIRPYLLDLHCRIQTARRCPELRDYHRIHLHPACEVQVRFLTHRRQRIVEKVWNFKASIFAVDLYKKILAVFTAIGKRQTFKLHPQLHITMMPSENKIKGYFTPVGRPTVIASPEQAFRCAMQVLRALEVLREVCVIHHDLRLSNIVCKGEPGADEQYFLIDFDDADLTDENGLCAAASSDRLSPTTHCPNTYHVHSFEVDMWSLGQLLLLELSRGKPTVAAAGLRIQQECQQLTFLEAREIINGAFD